MPREFYLAASTAASAGLYRRLKAAAPGLGRVSVLGGWAVHELVEPRYAMESLDIDVLIHDDAAWLPTIRHFRAEGLRWRELGRRRDRRLVPAGTPPQAEDGLAVDVFYGPGVREETLQHLFGTGWAANLKVLPYTGFVPALQNLVADKVATLPLRPFPDPRQKRLKDALDLHALLLHNREGRPAGPLLAEVPAEQVERAAVAVRALGQPAPYHGELQDLERALGA